MGGDESACGTTRADDFHAYVPRVGGSSKPGMYFQARFKDSRYHECRKTFTQNWWQSKGSADSVRSLITVISIFAALIDFCSLRLDGLLRPRVDGLSRADSSHIWAECGGFGGGHLGLSRRGGGGGEQRARRWWIIYDAEDDEVGRFGARSIVVSIIS